MIILIVVVIRRKAALILFTGKVNTIAIHHTIIQKKFLPDSNITPSLYQKDNIVYGTLSAERLVLSKISKPNTVINFLISASLSLLTKLLQM